MQPGNSAQVLREAMSRGTVKRPLLAPLASAIAGEMQAMEPRDFLRDATKLSNGVRDLTRSLNTDAAIAEFGTLWDAEAMGLSLDWKNGLPEPDGELPAAPPSEFTGNARATVVIETVRRLAGLIGQQKAIAASVTGPAKLSRLSNGAISPSDAVEHVLTATRGLCEAGASLILVTEDEPPEDPEDLAWEMEPVWSSIAFYQGAGALHLAGAADPWQPFIESGGQFLTCFDPDKSTAISEGFLKSGVFGLALRPGESSESARKLAAAGRCALLTNDAELYGKVAVRDLKGVVASLRGAGSEE